MLNPNSKPYICSMRLIIFFSLLFTSGVYAQPKLVLLKNNTIITRFEEGENIRFKRRADKDFSKSIIQGIHSGFLILGEDTINFYDIEKIDIRKKPLTTFKTSVMGKTLIVAGASLFIVDYFNQRVIQGNDFRSNDAVVRGGLILIGVGGILQFLNNNYFRIHGRRKIAAINL